MVVTEYGVTKMELQTKGNKARSRYKYITLNLNIAWGWRMFTPGQPGVGHFQIRGKDIAENSYNLELSVEEAEKIHNDIGDFLQQNRERHMRTITGKEP